MSRSEEVFLADIVEACDTIAGYTRGMTLREFRGDRRTVDAVVRNLEVIGEAAKQVSAATRMLIPAVDWSRMSGLRDVLIHQYFGIDDEIVWQVVEVKLPQVRSAIDAHLRN